LGIFIIYHHVYFITQKTTVLTCCHPLDSSHCDDLSKRCWLDWNTWAHGLPEYPFYIEGGRCQFGSVCEFLHLKGTWSTTEVCILLPLSK
jgi:hypothetical protein